ncbi:Major facilitator superfamily protein [Prunus dulcis]|uniref:Major facilitator superfamily protein n=1 Tax=Prunus dulcis TaxID=3755 RepID=A0A4Y1RVQ6_PRUDU|nr:Major facilitator superfamily protein [Prunus dulcis]
MKTMGSSMFTTGMSFWRATGGGGGWVGAAIIMFPWQFLTSPAGKWLGFVTAIWVQAISGNNYTFSNYSHALKSLMALTQLQLNNLSVAKDVGKAFGLLSGLASDRWPTSIILIFGAVEGLIGYGIQWLVVSQRISPLPYWQMCIFMCIGGNSTTWMNTAVLVTCMRNFAKNRGPVSGILKGPAIVCLTGVLFLKETEPASMPSEQKQEAEFFHAFDVIAIAVAVYLLAFDITGTHGRVLSLAFVIGLAVLLAMPLGVPLYTFLYTPSGTQPSCHNDDIEHQIKEPLLAKIGGPIEKPPEIQNSNEGINLRDIMGLALGYHDVSIFVSLTSIWGFFGRIVSGLASEYYIGKCGTPRPLWNAAAEVLMALGFIAMASALPGSFYIGSILVGMGYGVLLTITVPVASELFGLKYYGLLYNILILNLPLGSFLFSGLLAGLLYDAQATSTSGGGTTCVGPHCYMLVFVIMAIACMLGLALDVLLAFRTKNIGRVEFMMSYNIVNEKYH